MEYKIEAIGSAFTDKAIGQLASKFTNHAHDGFKFHSVFQVQQPGCLGIGQGTVTYLAVYVKEK